VPVDIKSCIIGITPPGGMGLQAGRGPE